MKKSAKIWLIIALVLCICTTILNTLEGRILSAGIAVVSIAAMAVLLSKEKRNAFYLMCICAAGSFAIGAFQSIAGGTGVLVSIVMSLIGSAMVPGITYLFIRKDWDALN